MNDGERARSTSGSEWDRARRAYRALLSDCDPAATVVERLDALDLRPGGDASAPDDGPPRAVVVSGPADLRELREIIETATGIGTWPTPPGGEGEIRTAQIEIQRPAPLLALLLAMDGLIEDRSPWRTWRTAVDTVAGRVGGLRVVTVEARIIEPGS